jgi:NADPH-dependent 2,4-dienoyl-CoA reductase/sulfur reductase-like enzyme
MSGKVHVIVGAGQAGAHAAVAMREAGFAGRIVLLGEEPHPPYERPPLSKAALTDDPQPEPGWFFAQARYAELRIELRLGSSVTAIDTAAARIALANGETLPYDALLLATGGRARTLVVAGGERVLLVRTLDDARRLRPLLRQGSRVVCIGAGVIGLETAASAHKLGCRVTVLEAGPAAMGRSMTPGMATWVAKLHRDAGVALHFGAAVEEITSDAVRCAGGLGVPADLVVAGVGMVRNTELARAAGLAVDNGIAVDEVGRTGIAGVYAAGEVAAFWVPRLHRRLRLEAWRHAQDHGIAVGRAMAGVAEPYDPVPWFWTDQHGATIQVAGQPTEAVTSIVRGETTAPSFAAFHLDEAGRVVAATGVNAAREVRAAMALIRSGALVDPALLADPRTKVQALAKAG